MTLLQLLDRWRIKRDAYRQDGALVSGEKVAALVIADLETVIAAGPEQLVTLTRAAELSGFSADYLRRLIRTGDLADHGKPHKPLVSVESLPRKAGCLLNHPEDANISDTRRRVAFSVIHPAA